MPSSDYVNSPTVVGAQAANELLNIVGVKASFVLTEYKGVIYISARAIDEVNVQNHHGADRRRRSSEYGRMPAKDRRSGGGAPPPKINLNRNAGWRRNLI